MCVSIKVRTVQQRLDLYGLKGRSKLEPALKGIARVFSIRNRGKA